MEKWFFTLKNLICYQNLLGFNEDNDQLPGLLKQEKEALSVYLFVVFTSYTKQEESNTENRNKFLNRFIE